MYGASEMTLVITHTYIHIYMYIHVAGRLRGEGELKPASPLRLEPYE